MSVQSILVCMKDGLILACVSGSAENYSALVFKNQEVRNLNVPLLDFELGVNFPSVSFILLLGAGKSAPFRLFSSPTSELR